MQVLKDLDPFIKSPEEAKGSVLLAEVSQSSSPEKCDLLHNLTASGSYIQLLIYLAKCGQVGEAHAHIHVHVPYYSLLYVE